MEFALFSFSFDWVVDAFTTVKIKKKKFRLNEPKEFLSSGKNGEEFNCCRIAARFERILCEIESRLWYAPESLIC